MRATAVLVTALALLMLLGKVGCSSAAVVAGGAGYAASFSSTRTDVAGFRMPDDVSFDNITLQAWIKVGSTFQDHAVASYQSYDYSTTPAAESDNEILLWLKPSLQNRASQVEFSVSGTRYLCTAPACGLVDSAESTNWTHLAVVWQRHGDGYPASPRKATL